jgi:Fe(3+) dicitrate transport protein
MKFNFLRTGIGVLFLLVSASVVFAADDQLSESVEVEMREVAIIGSKFNIKDIAGSAAFLDTQDIRQHNIDDINRILRRVPGVNLRGEDGFGLFPNISLRGIDAARSAKVTVMEDGILQAPAPYAAPDAYYSPTAGRMASIEVLKGSSQIKFGPRTTGGAINYISTRIPTSNQIYLKAGFGSFSEIRNHLYYGGSSITESGGKFGYLVEMYTRNNRGFKSLIKEDTDGIASLRNGAELDSGFVKVEPMLKLSYEPKSALYQRWEAKFGHTNLDANETYLGLPEGLSGSHTYGRLAASRFDEIESTQYRSYIRHLIEFSPKTSLTTTLYGNTFNRNWQKLNDVNGGDSLSEALAATGSTNYQILAGKAAGDFTLRNNNRAYYSYGAQMTLQHQLQAGDIEHNLEVGVRLHEDQIRRKQWDETFTQDANGNITARTGADNVRGAAGNRTQNVFAMSTHLQDQMKFGKFTFTPGMRIENMSAEYCDGGCGNAGVTKGDRTYAVVVGGGSLKYDVFDSGGRDFDVFGGIHRGFSPADPRSNIRSGITEETSIGMELGARYKNAPRAFSTEAVLFNTILDNLVVADSIGGAGAGSSVNAGKVQSTGLEFQVNYDRGLDKGWSFQMPMYVTATYTNATFLETAGGSSDQESIFAGANIGNMVPYIPELNLSFGIGTIFKKWSANIDANFVSIAYADAANQNNQVNPATGVGDVRFGSIPSRLVIDGSLGYKLSDKARLFGNLKNMTANEYIISRQPHGPRPGLPFSVMAGLEIQL